MSRDTRQPMLCAHLSIAGALEIAVAVGRSGATMRIGIGRTDDVRGSSLYSVRMSSRRHFTIAVDDSVELALRRNRRSFPTGTSDSQILAELVTKGDQALEREGRAREQDEQRRRAAAARLADRFRRPDGFDYPALEEASARWLQE
jgi:hypothetical protein